MKQAPLAHMAEELRSKGRGDDTMLVHMTPAEVGGLQELALASGGSLTINPDTGLPEAGWLGRLLPTILGVAGAAFGLPTWAIGLGGLAGGTAATGDLGKGVMAGLGAMGGAGLANAAGLGGSIMGGAGGAAQAAQPVSAAVTGQGALNTAATAPAGALGSVATPGGPMTLAAPNLGAPVVNTAAQTAATEVAKNPSFLQKFAADTSLGTKGLVGKALPMAAGYAAVAPLLTPDYAKVDVTEEEDMEIPRYGPRALDPRLDPRYPRGEINFFDNNPAVRMAEGDQVPAKGLGEYVSMFRTSPGPVTAPLGYPGGGPSAQIKAALAAQQPAAPAVGMLPPRAGMFDIARAPTTAPTIYPDRSLLERLGGMTIRDRMAATRLNAYAAGGEVHMESGGFVMPARETAEFGNGDTDAGQRKLAALGGIPIRGKGDGVSDSIPARIDGKHAARLATGETYFPPAAVKKLGGAAKLRALMNAATESRRRAERGGEHKIRGLA